MKTLSLVKDGESVYIESLHGSDAYKARMEEMGFVVGQRITRVGASPLGTPIVYALLGTKVSLRRDEAHGVRVSEEPLTPECYARTSLASTLRPATYEAGEQQACSASGACPGCCSKCQAKKRAVKPHTLTIALIGNPNCGKTAFFNAASGGHERTGNYAGVTVTSVEGYADIEGHHVRVIDLPGAYSLRAISPDEAFVVNELEKGEVDVIVNVVDATNLERNLSLTLQLRDRGIPMIVALNMYDEFEKSGSRLDVSALEEKLGVQCVPTVAKNKKGVAEVLRKAVVVAEERIDKVNSGAVEEDVCTCPGRTSGGDACRYAEIRTMLSGVYQPQEGKLARLTAQLDRIFAYRPVAYLSFLLVMWFVFEMTFTIGAYPMDWMDAGVAWLAELVAAAMPAGMLADLVTQGIIGGVGSVIVFLPNILILYFFISLLEDSGYLARTALLADPLLAKVGLHGKSVIPMIMGFGCNVPAIMATRTIESYKSRLLTMLVLPFVTCSARMPVLVIFTGVFFAPQYAGSILFALYVFGIFVTFASAWLMQHFVQRDRESHFVMEIPPYRTPMLTSVLRHTWEKGRQYLRKMGGVILIASMVIWALGYFPQSTSDISEAEQQEQSYLGALGKGIQPVLAPLGFDWKMSVGILSGIGAKELMVSTLGVIYDCPEDAELEDAESASHSRLAAALRGTVPQDVALAYLVFALLYFPCIATIAAVAGESGRWKYAIFTMCYTTGVAYLAALLARWVF